MTLCWDEDKRQRTLKERGLDFARCEEVFNGPTFNYRDDRYDEEQRIITLGFLDTKLVVIVRTELGDDLTRIISMRRATPGERKRYEKEMD